MSTALTGVRPTVRFGFEVPQTSEHAGDIETIRRVALRAEQAGFDDIWLSDAVSGGPHLDPLTVLPFLAAITSRVRLGVSVLVLPVHQPVHLAKRLASIDALSDGRLVAGVGLGGTWDVGYGITTERRVGTFMEVFRAAEALLRHQPEEYHGEQYSLSPASLGPRPVQRPRPPIWFGAIRQR